VGWSRGVRVALVTSVVMVASVAAAVAAVAFVGRGGRAMDMVASAKAPKGTQVFAVGVNGRRLRQLTSLPGAHSVALWMPGDRAVADVASRRLKAWIESRRINGHDRRDLSPVVSVDWSLLLVFSAASGRSAFETSGHRGLMLEAVGRPGSRPKVLDSWSAQYGQLFPPAWSPDGRLIAYERVTPPPPTEKEPRFGRWHVVVIAPDGKRRRVLTRGIADGSVSPVFSSDGRSIAFCGGGRQPGLYVVPIRRGRVRRITRGPCYGPLVWSPNGREIADVQYTKGSGGSPYVFVTTVRTGRAKKLGGPVQYDGPSSGQLAWSPDGKKIAFAGSTGPPGGGKGQQAPPGVLETINADGTGLRKLVRMRPSAVFDELAWSRDSKQIAFTASPEIGGY
jgi:Tol biopolymer transport system component